MTTAFAPASAASSWEQYRVPRFAAVHDGPAMTLYHNFSMGLNTAAMIALGRPTHVTLHWNPTTRQIGIQAASADDLTRRNPDLLRLRQQKRSHIALFSGVGFCKHYGVDPPARATSYPLLPAPRPDHGEPVMLVQDVEPTVSVVRSILQDAFRS